MACIASLNIVTLAKVTAMLRHPSLASNAHKILFILKCTTMKYLLTINASAVGTSNMYKEKKKRTFLQNTLILAFLFVPALVMTRMVMKDQSVSCEVCMQFQGHTQCRLASASSKEDCVRTAKDNACALLTSGMTNTIACSNTQPMSIK